MKGADYFKTVAVRSGLSGLHPAVGGLLREYVEDEKAVEFDGKLVLNTHFPPWPSRAFERG